MDRFPWDMYVKEGAEQVRSWNLPEAVENPLFGLPEIPQTYSLPNSPFLFLRRYERKHAEIFFGRSYYIRDLYNQLTDKKSAPVILLYGQSGVGKSSLLEAGVLPRMEMSHEVRYLRRVKEKGLLGTMELALQTEGSSQEQELAPEIASRLAEREERIQALERFAKGADPELQEEVLQLIARFKERSHIGSKKWEPDENEDASPVQDFARAWKAIEHQAKRPLIIILDQVEEVYTQTAEHLPNELEGFLGVIKQIFDDPQTRPQGKLLLSYRKEYHPEIEQFFKTLEIPRERLFLQHLMRKDIVEVVKGLTLTKRLKRRYNLYVEDSLPIIIADDLLEDKDSSVAPVLQILLTKMWRLEEDKNSRQFSVALYQDLRKEGILLDDFFHQQMNKIALWNKETITSGLALDILNYHTSSLGTAETRSNDDLQSRYTHRSEILPSLFIKFKELYLLGDRSGNTTAIAHDTLAPLVQQEYRQSDYAGQRAARILANKVIDFVEDRRILLDAKDLELVENGLQGMRSLSVDEEELLRLSRKRRNRATFFWRGLQVTALCVVAIIGGLYLLAQQQRRKAEMEKLEADRQRFLASQSAELALIRQYDAIYAQCDAEGEREIAVIKEQEATEASLRADEAAKVAQEKRTIAEQKEQEAREAEKRAKIAQERADQNALKEMNKSIEAKIQSYIASLNEADATFAQYKAKANQLAVKSYNQEEDSTQIQLAMTSYHLNYLAHNNLVETLKGVKNERKTELKKSKQERDEMAEELSKKFDGIEKGDSPEIKAASKTFSSLYKRLYRKAINDEVSFEIFGALNAAYRVAEKDRKDYLLKSNTECRVIFPTSDGAVYLNNSAGKLAIGYPAALPKSFPYMAGTQELTYPEEYGWQEIQHVVTQDKRIIGGSREGTIFMWDKPDDKTPRLLVQETAPILALDLDRQDNILYYVTRNTLYAYDIQKGYATEILSEPENVQIEDMDVTHQGDTYIAFYSTNSSVSGKVIQYNLHTGEKRTLLQSEDRGYFALDYNPRKDWLAVSYGKGYIYIYPNATNTTKINKALILPKPHLGIPNVVRFSLNGNYLVTGDLGGTLMLWNTTSRNPDKLVRDLPQLVERENNKIIAAAFSHTNEYLYFSDQNHIHVVPTSPDYVADRLCKRNWTIINKKTWAELIGSDLAYRESFCKIK